MEIESRTAIENASPILRPMGFGELLDTTFSLYRKNFLRYLGICSFYFFIMVIASLISLLNGSIPRHEWLAIWLPTLFVIFCIAIIVVNALMSATAQAYLVGNIATIKVFDLGVRRFFACFGGLLLYGLLAIITAILIVFPFGLISETLPMNYIFYVVLGLFYFLITIFIAAYFGTYWCFFAAAVLVEGKSIQDAIRRRRELVRRMSFKIVGTTMAIFLLYSVISFILRFSFSLLFALTGLINMAEFERKLGSLMFIQFPIIQDELNLLNILLYAINLSVDTITMPIWVIGAILLYFDQRIRKEGFDIEMVAERQGG